MIVESEELFPEEEPTIATNTGRAVSLVRVPGKDIWEIVLDGSNTSIRFTQNLVDSIKVNGRYDMVGSIIDGFVEDLDYEGWDITLDEHLNLTKLFFSLL